MRETILRRRGALDAGTRVALGRSIVARIVELEAYRRSVVVMAYASFGSELPTDGFLRHVLDEGKTLVLPRVNREKGLLELYEVGDPIRDLRPGAWGIREPRPERCRRAGPDDLGFVLVPGVAFDPTGGRLGYGGGYYDRLLAERDPARTALVAGAFEVQIVEEVPIEAHDLRVDVIVTEGRYCSATSDGHRDPEQGDHEEHRGTRRSPGSIG